MKLQQIQNMACSIFLILFFFHLNANGQIILGRPIDEKQFIFIESVYEAKRKILQNERAIANCLEAEAEIHQIIDSAFNIYLISKKKQLKELMEIKQQLLNIKIDICVESIGKNEGVHLLRTHFYLSINSKSSPTIFEEQEQEQEQKQKQTQKCNHIEEKALQKNQEKYNTSKEDTTNNDSIQKLINYFEIIKHEIFSESIRNMIKEKLEDQLLKTIEQYKLN